MENGMKITIGKSKTQQKHTDSTEQFIFALGLMLMCAMLVFPLWRKDSDSFSSDAVAVMGNMSDESAEVIKTPENTSASTEERWSFYDYIGELFAGILFGER